MLSSRDPITHSHFKFSFSLEGWESLQLCRRVGGDCQRFARR